jgi:hypothetical protein
VRRYRLDYGACDRRLRGQERRSDPEVAARKIIELAHAFEPFQDGRIYIEAINGPFLFQHKGTPAEYSAGLKLCIERGWLELHESGTFVKFTQHGEDLLSSG